MATPDMMSPATSDRHLPELKNRPKMPRRFWVEFGWFGILPATPIGGHLVYFINGRRDR